MSSPRLIGLHIDDFTSIDNRSGWCSSAATQMTPELSDKSRSKEFIVQHWTTISRILSLVLILLIWFLLLMALKSENRPVLFYMVFAATLVTFFESMFILHWLFCSNERKDTRLHKVWNLLLGVNTWKKLVLYLVLSLVAFYEPKKAPLTLTCGVLINLIGIIEFIHLFREKNTRKPILYRQLGIY